MDSQAQQSPHIQTVMKSKHSSLDNYFSVSTRLMLYKIKTSDTREENSRTNDYGSPSVKFEQALKRSASVSTTETIANRVNNQTNKEKQRRIQEATKRLICALPDGSCSRKLKERYQQCYNEKIDAKSIPAGKQDGKFEMSKETHTSTDETIPFVLPGGTEMHFDSNGYPHDVMLPGDTIPVAMMSNDDKQIYSPVTIDEAYDPSKFWFTLANNEQKIEEYIQSIEDFYSVHSVDYAVSETQLVPGLYVIVFEREMQVYRAVVAKVNPIKVFCIDDGDVQRGTLDNIYFMHKKFSDLPRQALRGRLSGVVPPGKNAQWSREAAYRFLELVQLRKFDGSIVRTDCSQGDRIYELVLRDSSKDGEIFIHDVLLSEGCAITPDQEPWEAVQADYEPAVTNLHLYPLFIEIEMAVVPTHAEMRQLIARNVPLYEIYPIYFNRVADNKVIQWLKDSAGATKQEIERVVNDRGSASGESSISLGMEGLHTFEEQEQDEREVTLDNIDDVVPPQPLPVVPPFPTIIVRKGPDYIHRGLFNNIPSLNCGFPLLHPVLRNNFLHDPQTHWRQMMQCRQRVREFFQNQPRGSVFQPAVRKPLNCAWEPIDDRVTSTTDGPLTNTNLVPEETCMKISQKKKYVISTLFLGKPIHIIRIMSLPCVAVLEIQEMFTGRKDIDLLRRLFIVTDLVMSVLRLDSINYQLLHELATNHLFSDHSCMQYTSLSSLQKMVTCITREECVYPNFKEWVDQFSEQSSIWNFED